MATGYSRFDLRQQRRPFQHITTGVLQPATGFCSTAHDLAKFFAALQVGSSKLLSDASKREMLKTVSGSSVIAAVIQDLSAVPGRGQTME